MPNVAEASAYTEPQFAALVDALASDPERGEQLIELLREDHPSYDQRGTATTVRMRGWVLVALARTGVSDAALLFVLEELDTGVSAYLVAAAARALRSYQNPHPSFAPFVMRALTNIRYHDELVSFAEYGEYATSSTGTSAVRELLATLEWLGPLARGVIDELETLRAERGGLAKKLQRELSQASVAIRGDESSDPPPSDTCCSLPNVLRNPFSWALGSRRGCEPIEETRFEDQDGGSITFRECFRGQPTIVVFFYTRCDNPLKCSLTIARLATMQKLLEAKGLADQINTAAITYDPAYDHSERINRYGQKRGVRMDDHHRMLRAPDGLEPIRRHFRLGVNFIESLVNRHRVEVYILDREGGIAASFERIRWDEEQVVERAIEVLNETGPDAAPERASEQPPHRSVRKPVVPVLGMLASLAVAFFPKCPICWAAYMSMFGIAGLNQVPYSPWLQPVLVAVMLINLASVWFRARSTGRMTPFYLVAAGALAIIASKLGIGLESAAMAGVLLTFLGSFLSALNAKRWAVSGGR